jgi:hypothetical protein
VNKRETDISQIKKYLNGELDAKAMHRLERRAQDDPFLMDALEGYEMTAGNQQEQLDELNSRLHRRIARKQGMIIPWKIMGIAASIIVMFSTGGLWFYNNFRHSSTPKLTLIVKPIIKTIPAASPHAIQENNTLTTTSKLVPHKTNSQKYSRISKTKFIPPGTVILDNKIANMNAKDSVPQDSTPLNEVIVMGYTTQRKKDVTASTASISPVATEKALQGQAAGVMLTRDSKRFKIKSLSKSMIKGQVIDKNDRTPLPGVTVKVAGTNIGTQTDSNGRFYLSADSSKASLVIASIGYQTQKIHLNSRDSIETIALEPNNSSLNEVVVTGYGAAKNADEIASIATHPQTGWSSFNKYLKENAVSPDGKTGVVKLSFQVDFNGILSDIKVIKGLSDAANKKAIDLISSGPGWTGNTNGKPEKVNLRIRFGK